MTETKEMLHELWTVTRGENSTCYELVSDPFILTVFYADAHDYAYVVWNNDENTCESAYSTVNDVAYVQKGMYGVFSDALYMLTEAEDDYKADCEDQYYLTGAFDSENDPADVADDFMRADSDLWEEF